MPSSTTRATAGSSSPWARSWTEQASTSSGTAPHQSGLIAGEVVDCELLAGTDGDRV